MEVIKYRYEFEVDGESFAGTTMGDSYHTAEANALRNHGFAYPNADIIVNTERIGTTTVDM